jgi:hypothetical protein
LDGFFEIVEVMMAISAISTSGASAALQAARLAEREKKPQQGNDVIAQLQQSAQVATKREAKAQETTRVQETQETRRTTTVRREDESQQDARRVSQGQVDATNQRLDQFRSALQNDQNVAFLAKQQAKDATVQTQELRQSPKLAEARRTVEVQESQLTTQRDQSQRVTQVDLADRAQQVSRRNDVRAEDERRFLNRSAVGSTVNTTA